MNTIGSKNQKKNYFYKFLHSEDGKLSLIRDVLIAVILVLIILSALWAYTGQWFGTPMVAIESGSMMHRDEPYGRYGTIDAGDMVLLVKIEGRNDIVTFAAKNPDEHSYGKYGDVIIYRPYGQEDRDQIIHRAMCWVDVNIVDNKKYYTIEEYGIINQSSDIKLHIPELGIRTEPTLKNPNGNSIKVDWSHSGFITKGDNPDTNPTCDQIGGICTEPIKVEWISGKARAELPWIGTINLIFNDLVSGKNTFSNIPKDSISCITLLLEFLILIPIVLDLHSNYKEKKRQLSVFYQKYQKNKNDQNIDQLKIYKQEKKDLLSDLFSIIFIYWVSFVIFILIWMFLLYGVIGYILQALLIILFHLILLILVKIQGKLLRTKDLQKWLIIVAISGPIGISVYYYNEYLKINN